MAGGDLQLQVADLVLDTHHFLQLQPVLQLLQEQKTVVLNR